MFLLYVYQFSYHFSVLNDKDNMASQTVMDKTPLPTKFKIRSDFGIRYDFGHIVGSTVRVLSGRFFIWIWHSDQRSMLLAIVSLILSHICCI